jgi:hypothetical protein
MRSAANGITIGKLRNAADACDHFLERGRFGRPLCRKPLEVARNLSRPASRRASQIAPRRKRELSVKTTYWLPMSSMLKPQHLRSLIAQQAARMMAEEGAEDYAYAKRKAARQLGMTDERCLPTNAEIERELKLHHEIYRREEQPQHLFQLRTEALGIMRQFSQFNPHLAGGVLDGTAGRYAGTDIHLFADSLKDVEIFLLNRAIPYQMEERSYRIGQAKRRVPVFAIEGEQGTIRLTVFSPEDLRSMPKVLPGEQTPVRAAIVVVEGLLANTDKI